MPTLCFIRNYNQKSQCSKMIFIKVSNSCQAVIHVQVMMDTCAEPCYSNSDACIVENTSCAI
jgi:hypothetical protein